MTIPTFRSVQPQINIVGGPDKFVREARPTAGAEDCAGLPRLLRCAVSTGLRNETEARRARNPLGAVARGAAKGRVAPALSRSAYDQIERLLTVEAPVYKAILNEITTLDIALAEILCRSKSHALGSCTLAL